MTGAIAWYRAMASIGQPREKGDEPRQRIGLGPVTCPTTYVWGRRDAYLGAAAARRTERFCADDYRFVELDADHWLAEKYPDEVSEAILARVSE